MPGIEISDIKAETRHMATNATITTCQPNGTISEGSLVLDRAVMNGIIMAYHSM